MCLYTNNVFCLNKLLVPVILKLSCLAFAIYILISLSREIFDAWMLNLSRKTTRQRMAIRKGKKISIVKQYVLVASEGSKPRESQ